MKKRRRHRKLPILLLLCTAAVLSAAFYLVSCFRAPQEASREEIEREIRRWAAHYHLPPELVSAVIWQESRYSSTRVGSRGEIGLMQLMPPGTPGAAEEWARVNKCHVPSRKELFSASKNIEIGCWYLSRIMARWKNYRFGVHLALAQYNAGAKKANEWKPDTPDGEVIPRIDYPGTRDYVTKIWSRYQMLLREKKK